MTTRTNNNNQQQHYSVNDHDDFEERHGEVLDNSTTENFKTKFETYISFEEGE